MNKKIPTLKKIEKEFEEKFSFLYTGEATVTPERVWAFSNSQEIKSFFRQRIGEILNYLEMEELKEGKHDGHNNDDRCWCYQCQEVGEEGDFTDNHRYNQAVRKLNAKIEKIRGR